jgi:hypothetical protein
MIHSRSLARRTLAVSVALALTVLAAGVALAHPPAEGSHSSGCIVIVEPGSVAVGGQFTVTGQGFGGASIFIVKGAGASPAAGAVPNATTPAGTQGFSVTFTAEAADVGNLTVWGLLPESECGDSDQVTVTAVPNTAVPQPSSLAVIGWLALGTALAVGVRRVMSRHAPGRPA